jgi:hypothetical protein
MRAGCSAIACGLSTPRALHAWPPQPQHSPHGGSLYTPGRHGARTRVQLRLRHRPATLQTPTPSPASTWTPHRSSTSSQTLRIPSPRTTLLSNPYQGWPLAGYNVHTCREIRLLARTQARRPDKWRLTLRRLPRLASFPEGNTACSSRGVHSN